MAHAFDFNNLSQTCLRSEDCYLHKKGYETSVGDEGSFAPRLRSSAALLAIFVLGALVGQGHLFAPVAAAIRMTILLAWKVELHRFAGGLQPAEIRNGVLLGLFGLVVYPILPDHFVDGWELINPRQAWITVVVIASIGFVNYVLLKVYAAKGLYLSGFLGGFVNSSATAVELAKSRGTGSTSSGVAIAALLLTICRDVCTQSDYSGAVLPIYSAHRSRTAPRNGRRSTDLRTSRPGRH
jgi:hypothetical protein